jgi:Kelch motif protein/galactose oxidase-like protein
VKVVAAAFVLLVLPAGAVKLEPSRSMGAPRAVHTATLLASGEVLITGGCTRPGCETDERSAASELYSPSRARFEPGPRMRRGRAGHTATLLPDGSVLVAGGYGGEGEPPTATAEVYDAKRRSFVAVGSLATPRGGFTATRLRDGRVLVVGGTDGTRTLSTAELFDPRTRRFTPTGRMRLARAAHAATLLPSGRVLIVGGSTGRGRVFASVEVYDPRTGRFTSAGRLRVARQKHAAVALRNGTVLVIGGSNARDFFGRYATAEVFDPRAGRSRRLVRMAEARFKLPDAVVRLRSGRVLVAGGGTGVEVFNPRTGRFRPAGPIGARLSFTTATLLVDGRVLVAGGYDDDINVTSRAWTYRG